MILLSWSCICLFVCYFLSACLSVLFCCCRHCKHTQVQFPPRKTGEGVSEAELRMRRIIHIALWSLLEACA